MQIPELIHIIGVAGGFGVLGVGLGRLYIQKNSRAIGLDLVYMAMAISFLMLLATTIFPMDTGIGNILLHAIGGGVAASCLFEYIRRVYRVAVTPLQEVVLLFFFVSGFGVANELLEFLLQSVSGMRFSLSPVDTWLDLLANTCGALAGWMVFLSRRK